MNVLIFCLEKIYLELSINYFGRDIDICQTNTVTPPITMMVPPLSGLKG